MKKILLVILSVLSSLLVVASIFVMWLSGMINVPITIDGEDGPTSIFIAGGIENDTILYVATVVVIIITLTVFWVTVIKKKKK